MTTTLNPAPHSTVHYTEQGQGPALVLVHGASATAQSNFANVLPKLAAQRRVVTPNYGGSGNSTIPDGPLSLDTLIEQIAAVIHHAGQGKPVELLGDSLGAVVAAATAARYPALIERLVLVAGWADSFDARHQWVFNTWASMERHSPETGNRFAIPLAVSPPFLTQLGCDTLALLASQAMPPDTLRRIELGGRIDLREQLGRISAPTLVVGCRQDYLVPSYQVQQLHSLIKHSTYAELDCGHAAFLEQPEELLDLVCNFLFD